MTNAGEMHDDLREELRQLLGEAPESLEGPLVKDLWPRYFREEGRHLKTADDVERVGRGFIAIWGERTALSLTTEDVESYRDERKASATRFGRPPAPATTDNELVRLRRCLQ